MARPLEIDAVVPPDLRRQRNDSGEWSRSADLWTTRSGGVTGSGRRENWGMTGTTDLAALSLDDVRLTRELLASGLDERAITRAVRAGALHRIRHGAYVDQSLWQRLSDRDRHRLLVRAVLKSRPATYVVSHYSALAEHGVDLWGLDLSRAQLTHADRRPRRSEAGVVVHRGRLREEDVVTARGLPVVTVARAVLETCCHHDVEVGLVVANSALNKGLVTADELRELHTRVERWPGAIQLQMVLRRMDGRMQSVAETRCAHLLHHQNLPRPTPQVEVRDEHGFLVGITDFAWPGHGVFLEVDGRAKYVVHRRSGETLEEYLMREKAREERICQLTGWVCLRISWADLENPVRTGRRIHAVLASRRMPA